MTITHKERLRRALCNEPVDHLPTQINYTGAMGVKLAEHFSVSLQQLPVRLDNHLIRVDIRHSGKLSEDGKARFDWWGAGHDTSEEGYYIRVNPLAGSKDLDAFWPNPADPALLEDARKVVETIGDELFIVPNFGFALFERAWALRGFEQLFVDMGAKTKHLSRHYSTTSWTFN